MLDVAEQGDATARLLIEDQGRRLAGYALAAARRVELDTIGTALARMAACSAIKAICSLMPSGPSRPSGAAFDIRRRAFEPAVGALLLALEREGAATPSTTRRVVETASAAPFFATRPIL